MKYLSKLSMLLLFVALGFCSCDNDNGNVDCIYPPTPTTHISTYSVTVVTVVEAPQAEVKNAIEQDLAANPPFGGCDFYQIVTTKTSATLPALLKLCVAKVDSKKWYGVYAIETSAEKFEDNDNYRLFPTSTKTSALAKWDIEDYTSVKPKLVGTYDVFAQCADPESKKGANLFFCEDLTKYYREKYPNADIHAVVRRQVLTFVKGEDVIKD